MRQLHSECQNIDSFLTKYGMNYSIEELTAYRMDFEWPVNIKKFDDFINKRKLELIKIWTED